MQYEIGMNITANLAGEIITGVITNIGEHKGKKCYDIATGGKYDRFVYVNQIIRIN